MTTARLAIESHGHLRRIAQKEGIDFDCENRGILHFCHSRAEFDVAAQVSGLLAKGGLECRAVAPEEMRSIEPALQGSFFRGFYTESDFTADIHKFTTGLARACERLSARLKFSAEVLSIALDNGQDVLVVGDRPNRTET